MGIPAAAAACGTKVYRQAVTKNVENCPRLPKKADENLRRRGRPPCAVEAREAEEG